MVLVSGANKSAAPGDGPAIFGASRDGETTTATTTTTTTTTTTFTRLPYVPKLTATVTQVF